MEENKKRRHTCFIIKESNPNLETKLSVQTILKDLNLGHLNPIFEREEVITVMIRYKYSSILHFQINLTAFFTLKNDDLQAIGIENEDAREKLLEFITNCSTPKNFKKIPEKNILIRH